MVLLIHCESTANMSRITQSNVYHVTFDGFGYYIWDDWKFDLEKSDISENKSTTSNVINLWKFLSDKKWREKEKLSMLKIGKITMFFFKIF